MFDVCIVGGGASGMACAITAARRGLSCIIVEKEAKLGRKIYASGNGKCNVTNYNFDNRFDAYYNSSCNDYNMFLQKLFKNEHPDKEIIDFSFSIGIVTYDSDSYVYPRSLQASSVMWAFTDMIKNLGIKVLLKTCVDDINHTDEGYIINTDSETILAKNVVLACGGAGYKSLGGSFKGYETAKKLGILCTELRPSLCGLVTKEDLSGISGVRIKAKAVLTEKDYPEKHIGCEEGEIQFTDYGISGIMIFNLSGKVGQMLSEGRKALINIDFLPDLEDSMIIELFKNNNRKPKAILNSIINDKLAGYIIDVISTNINNSCDELSDELINGLIYKLHNFNLEITAVKDFDGAQVTAGGINLDELNPEDMSVINHEGLYAIGEMTDIDGICGGYNLTYAFISGIRAGEGIYDKTKSDKT